MAAVPPTPSPLRRGPWPTAWPAWPACLVAATLLARLAVTPLAAASSASSFAVAVKETDDGLPQNSVIAMTQTRDGYLWLGTREGLVRYDGFSFRTFDENNTPGL